MIMQAWCMLSRAIQARKHIDYGTDRTQDVSFGSPKRGQPQSCEALLQPPDITSAKSQIVQKVSRACAVFLMDVCDDCKVLIH